MYGYVAWDTSRWGKRQQASPPPNAANQRLAELERP
jgi:hypothetical protein